MISPISNAFEQLSEGLVPSNHTLSRDGAVALPKTCMRPPPMAWASRPCLAGLIRVGRMPMPRHGLYAAIGYLLMALGQCAQAAGDDDLKPTPPYVSPVPAKADWLMKVKTLSAPQPDAVLDAPSAAMVRALHITRVGETQRVILLLTDGKTQEFYHYRDHYLIPTNVPGRILVSPYVATAPPYPYFSQGFFGVDWIKPDLYVGVERYGSTQCFRYKGQKVNPLAGIPNLPPEALAQSKIPVSCEAWIDCKTRLPVAVGVDGEIFEYEYAPPPDHLDIPPPYEAAWKWQADQLSRLDAMKVR